MLSDDLLGDVYNYRPLIISTASIHGRDHPRRGYEVLAGYKPHIWIYRGNVVVSGIVCWNDPRETHLCKLLFVWRSVSQWQTVTTESIAEWKWNKERNSNWHLIQSESFQVWLRCEWRIASGTMWTLLPEVMVGVADVTKLPCDDEQRIQSAFAYIPVAWWYLSLSETSIAKKSWESRVVESSWHGMDFSWVMIQRRHQKTSAQIPPWNKGRFSGVLPQ
jgi:hypothetical protein